MKDLKTINQTQLKSLLRERVENPKNFTNKPLVIWKSNWDDGIQDRILEEVFLEYNSTPETKNKKWYRHTMLGSGLPLSNDLTDKTASDKKHNVYNAGLLVIDPLFMYMDYKSNPASLNLYYSLINNRKWENIEVAEDLPIVAYMCQPDKELEKPEKYPDAEQYIFEPDFEEWADWAQKEKNMPTYIIDFIRGNGDKDGITYRWYNFFNNQGSEEKMNRPGCCYPKKWQQMAVVLKREMENENLAKASDVPVKEFKVIFPNGISFDLRDEFIEFIKKNNL